MTGAIPPFSYISLWQAEEKLYTYLQQTNRAADLKILTKVVYNLDTMRRTEVFVK